MFWMSKRMHGREILMNIHLGNLQGEMTISEAPFTLF